MKVLEIHEIIEQMLNLDLTGFDVFTFDDCLYSQYKYYDFFKSFKKPMFYFFSTAIYRRNEVPKIVRCDIAHKQAILEHNYSGYMSLDEIHELAIAENIGLHGRNHLYLNNLNKFDQLKICHSETESMVFDFKKYGLTPEYFQAPYNYPSFYLNFLKKYGIFKTFCNRINIETLFEHESHDVWLNDISHEVQLYCKNFKPSYNG